MIAIADSSALVSHYDPSEPDSLPQGAAVVVSALARVEVASAFWRKARDGFIGAEVAGIVLRKFEDDWYGWRDLPPRFQRIGVAAAILARAAALTATHSLRTLDAIQLASALAAREAEPACRTMVVLDERLRDAAARERFDILPG